MARSKTFGPIGLKGLPIRSASMLVSSLRPVGGAVVVVAVVVVVVVVIVVPEFSNLLTVGVLLCVVFRLDCVGR